MTSIVASRPRAVLTWCGLAVALLWLATTGALAQDGRFDKGLLWRLEPPGGGQASYLLGTMQLAARFDGWHCSADLGHRKPDAGFFAAVQRRVGSAPADLLLLDDTVENVDAAIAAGWHAVLWTGTTSLEQALRGYLSTDR